MPETKATPSIYDQRLATISLPETILVLMMLTTIVMMITIIYEITICDTTMIIIKIMILPITYRN